MNWTYDGTIGANQKWDGSGTLGINNFFDNGTPPGYTPDSGSPLASGATVVSYPNLVTSTVTIYPKFAKRTDCAGNTCTRDEELQNYANWQTYYKDRVGMARSGLSYAFKDIGETIRIGWGSINTLSGSSKMDAGVSLFDSSRKSAFYTWLYSSSTAPTGSTPNRSAIYKVGQYFSRSDSNGPWGTSPLYSSTSTSTTTTGGSEPKTNHAACRRSSVMLMTDGYWNDNFTSVANVDNTTGNTITSTSASFTYVPAPPYSDDTSSTLADVAMRYWGTDLRSDLANSITTIPGVNEAFWQHLSFYGIGLGVYGTLPQTATTLAALTAGDISWPAATGNTTTTVDDMWHAAINGRGQFFSVGDVTALTTAIEKMMVSINRVTSSQSGISISTAYLIEDSVKYTPQYTTGEWTGNILARKIDPTTGNETTTSWQVSTIDSLTGDPVSTIPAYDSRNIFVGTASTSTPKAVTFTYTAMSSVGLLSSMTGTVDADLINFLRGDSTNEGTNAKYRKRNAMLGDIVNSAPVLVKKGIDLKYGGLPVGTAGAASYSTFLAAQANNTEGVLFVGANDGMLHAFRDGTTESPEDKGVEIFAYIPKSVLPNLHTLADKSYAHRYFVDGPLSQNFAYINSAWKNVLLGTTGAGAKAIYAINVTEPLNLDASKVLWEINSQTTGFSELGYVLSEVRAGILPSGDWVAIFGNGYESTSGIARLFIVNLNTGALIKSISTGVGGSNGLGAVRVVRNTYGQIIGAYAGDLKGNLWKFDLSSTSSSNWKVGLGGSPLIALGSTQPITAAPMVLEHTKPGYLVSFGTGKMFETSDVSTTDQQALYGVWDSVLFGDTTSTPAGVTLTGTSKLVQQTFGTSTVATLTVITTALATATQTVTWSTLSNNSVAWNSDQRGWYINLPNSGERAIYPERLVEGNAVVVNTISPISATTSSCTASGQGTGYLYAFDVFNGGSGNVVLRDSDGNALGNTISYYANGPVSVAGLGFYESVICGGGVASCTRVDACANDACGGDSTRIINERNWRQIFLR